VEEDLRASVAEANKRLQLSDQQMKIAIDQDTGSIVVTITDRKTGETVRQIPSEDALKLRRNLDSLTGILVDEKG
jgi:flagellar protein FlaG